MIENWKYYGLYGDEEFDIKVITQPDKLPKYAKTALLNYKFNDEIHYTKDGCSTNLFMRKQYKTFRKLIQAGLAQEKGNAWNKHIVWAPGMETWIRNLQEE